MMNKGKNSRNNGKTWCGCCWVRVPNRTVRTREKREWSVSPEVNENDREWTEDEQQSVFGKVVATF